MAGTLNSATIVNLLASPAMSGNGTTAKIFSDAEATLETNFSRTETYAREFPRNVGEYTFATMIGLPPPATRINDFQPAPLTTVSIENTKRFSTNTFGQAQALSDRTLELTVEKPISLRDQSVKALSWGMNLTMENDVIAMYVYAKTGLTSSLPTQLGVLGDDVDLLCADGLPLFSDSTAPHSFLTGTATNYNVLPTSAAGPNVDTLNAANTMAGEFVNSQGIPYGAELRDILSPTNQQVYWEVVRKSAGDPSTANRADNPAKYMKGLGTVKMINRLPQGVTIFTTSLCESKPENYKIQFVRMGGPKQFNIISQDRRCVTYNLIAEFRFQAPHQGLGYIRTA